MKLAINGGKPVRKKLFPAYCTIGREEKNAVNRVLDSGVLSQFIGGWNKHFYGGREVQALEREWEKYFKVKHAVAVNSCTSGLYAAVGAMDIKPGDEIIVSPYTMSASAVAPLIYNAKPVFADIEEDYFCLDVKSIEKKITKRTRGIIAVDLFGLPYDASAINRLAKKHGLFVIEDTAQAPGAKYENKFAGTLGNIGVFSLNYHKHIHCGEGGIVVTDDSKLAERVQLIRNHAEAVVGAKGEKNLSHLVGYNFRMTEIEAAITRCQLKKLPKLLSRRIENCNFLAQRLSEIPAIEPAKVRARCKHAFYVQPFKFDSRIANVSRDTFINAVKAELAPTQLREDEGVKINGGYVKPLYRLPVFHKQSKSECPVAERMHFQELFTHELMHSFMSKKDLNDVVRAFIKVWEHRRELK